MALVIVLGGATLLTADPRFVMVKPSIGFFAVGLIMLRTGWMTRYLPAIVTDNVAPSVPVFWGRMWAAMMLVLAVANLVVAFLVGPRAWAWFISVVPTAAQILLFALQYVSLRRHVRRTLPRRGARRIKARPGFSPPFCRHL